MSDQEIREKLQVEKKARVNAERREKYAKEKVLSEMKMFNQDDHSDFKCMFDKIDESSIDPELKFFWEVQRDIIATSKATDGILSKET